MRISERVSRSARQRAAVFVAAFLALGGCLSVGNDGGLVIDAPKGDAPFAMLSTVSRPLGDALPQAPIAGGAIVVKGPAGYCVEGKALRNRASGGFAMLASCQVITGGQDGYAVDLAVMTVSAVRGEERPSPQALSALFAAPALRSRVDDDVSLVRLASGGETQVPGSDPRHWRGAMTLNGYVLALAAYGPVDSHASGEGGRLLLLEMAKAIRAASPRMEKRSRTTVAKSGNSGTAKSANGG